MDGVDGEEILEFKTNGTYVITTTRGEIIRTGKYAVSDGYTLHWEEWAQIRPGAIVFPNQRDQPTAVGHTVVARIEVSKKRLKISDSSGSTQWKR